MAYFSKPGKEISRRKFIVASTTAAAGFSVFPTGLPGFSFGSRKPDSTFKGVQIGAITYSWRSMPSTAQDILNYCLEAGISSIELMGNVAEEFAGIPPMPPRPARDAPETELATYRHDADLAKESQREWRLSVSMSRASSCKAATLAATATRSRATRSCRRTPTPGTCR